MTYDVVYSCGHIESVSFDESMTEREIKKKIRWLEKSGLCKACFKEAKRKEREAEPLRLVIAVDTQTMLTPYVLLFGGFTSPHKEDIKRLGFKWLMLGVEFIESVGLNYNTNAWAKKYMTIDEMEVDIAAVKAALRGIRVVNRTDEKALKELKAYEKETHVRTKMIAGLVNAVPKPECPRLVAARNWNRKIYGNFSTGYYIFLDGEKQNITAGEAQMLTGYIGDLKEYEEKIDRIKYRNNM